MNPFIHTIHVRAASKGASVVFPEAEDPRILTAANRLASNGQCKVHLVTSSEAFYEQRMSGGQSLHQSVEMHLTDPTDDPIRLQIAEHLHARRKNKGMSMEESIERSGQPLWYAAGLVALEHVDACVAGAVHTTGDVLRAAIQTIGTREDNAIVSGSFMMSWDDGRAYAFADCAVFPYPSSEQLAKIAIDTAHTFRRLTGEDPRVAFLSFSTHGSANHESVDLVRNAYNLFRQLDPSTAADGPLQFDAALIPEIAQRKAPGSSVAGQANVFIFPNLDAGNIAYKITERLGGAVATGPIIQGLRRPMNDLSRGATSEDIVNTACIAALMS